MTQLGRIAFGPLTTSTLGFERFFNDVERWLDETEKSVGVDKFPPHNILKFEDNKYVVELAVAGFSKNEIDISFQDGTLTITGNKVDKVPAANYLCKGIGTRSFTKTIRVADTVEIKGAEFRDGILRIGLENVIPEHKKPRKVEIGETLEFLPQPKLLQE